MGRIIVPEKSIILPVSMAGAYRCQTRKYKSGKLQYDTGWFHNLITDGGIWQFHDLVPSSAFDAHGEIVDSVCVGTGSATPTTSDTQLDAFLAKVDNHGGEGFTSTGYVAAASPVPAYWWGRRSWQFDTGVAAGNLTEVGAFPQGRLYSNNQIIYDENTLFSRALITDDDGNPTSITVLSDEILTVYYELRYYLDLSDYPFTFTLNGSDITGVYRPAQATSYNVALRGQGQVGSDYIRYAVYSGDIGAVNSTPTGILGDQDTSSGDTFVGQPAVNDIANSGTCYKDIYSTLPISSGNGTIKSFMVTHNMWQYQFGQLSSPIVKTSGQQLQLGFRFTWGRYTP